MTFATPILLTFLAGLGSFLSPCILPIIPGFLSYLSSSSIKEATESNYANKMNENKSSNETESINYKQKGSAIVITKKVRINIFINTIYFILGFSLIFSILGVILNGILATSVGNSVQHYISYIGGIVIAAFGANLILSLKIRQLNFEKKLNKIPKFKTSYITSFVFGIAFAAGWTPCVGPILGSTFTLAATNPGTAYNLLLAYSLGLGIPFLITGAFFSQAVGIIKKMTKHLKYFNIVVGSILIIIGILIFFNQLTLLINVPFLGKLLNLGN